jgi:hypothetical protein
MLSSVLLSFGVILCNLVDSTNVLEESVTSFLRITLNMEAAGNFETLVPVYQTTKYYIPEKSSPHGHQHKDPKSYMSLSFPFLMNDISGACARACVCVCVCVCEYTTSA